MILWSVTNYSKTFATLHESWAKDRQIWIAASTHEGEEELILQAHHLLLKKHPNLLLLLVPRHPELFILWRI